MSSKPVLFWDFHGTLSLPDRVWFDAAMEVAAQHAPQKTLTEATLVKHLSGTCLPWFSIPSRDTRHLTAPGAWWEHSRQQFEEMFVRCGFDAGEATLMAAAMQEQVLQPHRYALFPDALGTLQQLKLRGYRSFVLSNNFPELESITHALGLTDVLEGVLVSGKIGFDKPRVEIFEAARSAANASADAWMMGDNPKDDIEGGNTAGFTTVAVHGVQAPAAHHVHDLSELLELLP